MLLWFCLCLGEKKAKLCIYEESRGLASLRLSKDYYKFLKQERFTCLCLVILCVETGRNIRE